MASIAAVQPVHVATWIEAGTGELAATENDYLEVSLSLGVEPAVLRAITQLESGGSGFVDGRPRILFERHYFHQLTNGQFSASNPEISSPAPGGYGPPGEHQYERLIQAMALDCGAALAATNWGLFQILGMFATKAGFECVDEFVAAQMDSERGQLDAGATLIKANPVMTEALRQKNWARFAALWRGPGSRDQYRTRLANFYAEASQHEQIHEE
jgi:hypothetical protein